jgi:hypothetical protein
MDGLFSKCFKSGGTDMKRSLLLLVGMMYLAGCATTSTPVKSGFLGEYAQKLRPVVLEDKATTMRWMKPRTDFTKYNKFMVDYVVFALADDSEYKGINGDEMKHLGDAASLAVVNAIKEKYPIVSEPGPDVLRVRVAIVGLKQSDPVQSGITTVIPVGLGISLIKKGATDAWIGSGATQGEMMCIDSLTNEVICAGHDVYTAGFTERFTKWGSVEEAFAYWAKRGARALDNVKARH